MKSPWLLPVLSTACVSALDAGSSFMSLCSDISLNPSTGVLSAGCNLSASDTAPINSSVDLNGCLGWGPSRESEPIKYMENEIYPSVDGRLSDYCGSCSLLKPGDSDKQVGYMFCSCSPQVSAIGLEATFDLATVVSVGDNGCLQCLNAKQECAVRQAAVPARPSVEDALRLLNHGSAIPNSRAILDAIDDEPCELSVQRLAETFPEALPETYENTGFTSCHDDYGLCCFKTHPSASQFIEGFKLINDSTYFYRFHYHQGRPLTRSKKWDKLASVFRICASPDRSLCVLPNTGPAWYFGEDPPITTTSSRSPEVTTVTTTTYVNSKGMATVATNLPPGAAARQLTWSLTTTTLHPTLVAARQNQAVSPLHEPREEGFALRDLLMDLLIQRQEGAKAETSTSTSTSTTSTTVPTLPTSPAQPTIALNGNTLDKEGVTRLIADHVHVRTKRPVAVSIQMVMVCSPNDGGIACNKQVGKPTLVVLKSPNAHRVSFKEDLDFLELGNAITKSATIDSQTTDFLVDLSITVTCQKVRHFGLRCQEDALSVLFNQDSQLTARHLGVRSPSTLSRRNSSSSSNSSRNGIIIDLSKVDVAELVNMMLAATNIDDIHKANLVLKVKALSCTSMDGNRGCSDVVVSLAEAGNVPLRIQPRIAMPPSPLSSMDDDKTTTVTKTKTKTEKGKSTTKTESFTVTKTTTEKAKPTTRSKSVTETKASSKSASTKTSTKSLTKTTSSRSTSTKSLTSKPTSTKTKTVTSSKSTATKTKTKEKSTRTKTVTKTLSEATSTKSKTNSSAKTATKTTTSSRPTRNKSVTSKSTLTKTKTETISSKSNDKNKTHASLATEISGASPRSTNAAASRPRNWITVLRGE
ncbi:hypothetical protein BD289DRAFT_483901 [Coniella lustricola]|uniref:Uncharacterized protein n=1 Tax=Coniella lustricola TaxID=2025994 RepID=A0A2T3A3W7_9PEZI|nr:hypothetical protein BD289DRAFT_483901 [Coniella lustricola]